MTTEKESWTAMEISEVDRYILAARLKGYLDDHHEAVALLSEGLTKHPDEVRLLQLRGEKRLIIRDLAGALVDLEHAVELIAGRPDRHEFYRPEIEADVVNIVLGRESLVREQHPAVSPESITATKHLSKGTQHSSVWHKLGLARYLNGHFDDAAVAFDRVGDVAVDEHLQISAWDWGYMSLRRAGRESEAERLLAGIGPLEELGEAVESPTITNVLKECHLQRLRLYRGEVGPEHLLRNDVKGGLAVSTLGYGVGNWYRYTGRPAAADRAFQRVITLGMWASFGYLAAEVDCARLPVLRPVG